MAYRRPTSAAGCLQLDASRLFVLLRLACASTPGSPAAPATGGDAGQIWRCSFAQRSKNAGTQATVSPRAGSLSLPASCSFSATRSTRLPLSLLLLDGGFAGVPVNRSPTAGN